MIYFAQPIDGGPVKIGHSDDVPARIRQLEAHYGRALAVLATMPSDHMVGRQPNTGLANLHIWKNKIL